MIYSIVTVLSGLFSLLELAIFIECIASWIPQIQGNKYMNIIHNFIYPILEQFVMFSSISLKYFYKYKI